MRKKVFNIMIALVMVISFNAVAVQAYAVSETEVREDDTAEPVNELNSNMSWYAYDKLSTINEWGWSWTEISNYGYPWTAMSKTITKEYTAVDVPAGVYYTEYIDDKWYAGKLKLTGSVVKIGPGFWQATYTGKINY